MQLDTWLYKRPGKIDSSGLIFSANEILYASYLKMTNGCIYFACGVPHIQKEINFLYFSPTWISQCFTSKLIHFAFWKIQNLVFLLKQLIVVQFFVICSFHDIWILENHGGIKKVCTSHFSSAIYKNLEKKITIFEAAIKIENKIWLTKRSPLMVLEFKSVA